VSEFSSYSPDWGAIKAPKLKPSQELGFVYADKWHKDAFKKHCADLKSAPASASELRLVEGSKSPTIEEIAEKQLKSIKNQQVGKLQRLWHLEKREMIENGEIEEAVFDQVEAPEFKRECVGHGTPGTKTVFERKTWKGFDEFRIRTEVDARNKVNAVEGKRKSTELTRAAANKIADSCAYVAMERGGYSTFVTFTFSNEQREKLAAGEVTIQKEVSRALDSFKKVYERGMPREGVKGRSDSFDYIWVVEIPKNKAGEDNPHVHLLMRWRVARSQFDAWAARLEKLWGHGTAHLEKIKDPVAAGAYMAKAAGYITKASGDDSQGLVIGNRYGISQCARAPGWEKFGEAQLHIMGQLLQDVYSHMSEQYGEVYAERKALNTRREKLLEEQKTAKAKSDTAAFEKAKGKRNSLAVVLTSVRDRIKAIPARSSRYQLVLSGADSFYRFIEWAKGKDKENGNERPEWLPEIEGSVFYKEGWAPDNFNAKDVSDFRKLRFKRERKKNAFDNDQLSWFQQRYESFKNDISTAWFEFSGLNEPVLLKG